ncbi:MAG: amino acid adenylation domain-containing protein [Oscillospiraceae bacterium]|nr:amino acid adenylation domain-containing protein [Oscillospiraceae bacterium]
MTHTTSVLEDLARQIAAQPEAVAVADAADKWTFARLGDGSDRLASCLIRQGVQPGQPVGVVARRSAAVVALFLAVLKAGGFYVPLDPDWKLEKLAHVCANAGLQLVLDTQTPGPLPDGVTALVCGQAEWEALADAAALAAIAARLRPENPLYLIYTSGSTGVPKGVLKTHGAMQSYIAAFTARYPATPADALGNQTPFFFDASAKDLYWMLHDGCRLEVLDTGLFSQPYHLIEYLNDRHITLISWVPSALVIVSQLDTFADILPNYLRAVFFIGEVFPMKHFLIWQNALPGVKFVNLYGQSELAGACCYYEVDRAFTPDDTLPIGRPFANAEVFLLDGDRVVTEPGQIGEIGIVSPALAAGYFGDAEKTAAAFGTFCDHGRTLRLFRTGDMARYTPEGLLVFAARCDAQIKHMGYRIELGEIEAAANSLPEITGCACLYDTAKNRIVLFCTVQDGATKASLRKALREKLSTYMIPSKIEILPQLPRNANGKTDRVLLRTLLP